MYKADSLEEILLAALLAVKLPLELVLTECLLRTGCRQISQGTFGLRAPAVLLIRRGAGRHARPRHDPVEYWQRGLGKLRNL